MVSTSLSPSPNTPSHPELRIVLETDSPYMVPANVYDDVPALKGKKFPICHSAMIPWTAKFVAAVVNEALNAKLGVEGLQASLWDADKVMAVARENARRMYGI
jgi:TatD DNase family protein